MNLKELIKPLALAALACSFAAGELRAQEEEVEVEEQQQEQQEEQEEVAQKPKKSKKSQKSKKSGEDLQKKFVIAIDKFGNKADASANQFDTLRSRIQARLVATRRFTVVEREKMKNVLSEKKLADSGITDDESEEAQTKSKSADFVLYGDVLFFGRDSANANEGGVSGSKLSARVELKLTITETKTAEVLAEKVLTGYGSSSRVATEGVSQSGNLSEQVERDAADDAARRVVEALREHVYPAKIIRVGKKTVTVNLTDGETEEDDVYDVFEAGEVEEDDDTGESIEVDGECLGRIRITRTTAKTSTAEPIGDLDIDDIEKGCIVRRVSLEMLKKEAKKKKEKAKKAFKSRF